MPSELRIGQYVDLQDAWDACHFALEILSGLRSACHPDSRQPRIEGLIRFQSQNPEDKEDAVYVAIDDVSLELAAVREPIAAGGEYASSAAKLVDSLLSRVTFRLFCNRITKCYEAAIAALPPELVERKEQRFFSEIVTAIFTEKPPNIHFPPESQMWMPFYQNLLDSVDLRQVAAEIDAELACSEIYEILRDVDFERLYAELEMEFARVVVARARHPTAVASKPPSGRLRKTKRATLHAVAAAILFKLKNPEATARDCAEEAGLSPSTLSGNPEWRQWRDRVEAAHTPQERRKVRKDWDHRSGEYILSVEDDDT